jgi:hypothetical protein
VLSDMRFPCWMDGRELERQASESMLRYRCGNRVA